MSKTISTNLQTKINNWQLINSKLIIAIENLNLIGVKDIFSLDIELNFNDSFSENEIIEMGQQKSEDIGDDAHNEIIKVLYKLFSNSNKNEMLELLAENLMYKQGHVMSVFRNKYFMHTENYEKALKYADVLINNLNFMSSERQHWIDGALYNSSNEFFDKFLIIYENRKIIGKESIIFPLCGKIQPCGKYYNINSWILYYDLYFQSFLDSHIKFIDINTSVDVLNSVFYTLAQYPLEQFLLKNSKVDEVVAFLMENYEDLTGVKKFEYMITKIYYNKYIEIKDLLEKEDHQNDISNIQNRRFRPLALKTKLVKFNKELRVFVDMSIRNTNSNECIDFFKSIGLPVEYYPILDDYVNLNNSVINKKIDNKIISKI